MDINYDSAPGPQPPHSVLVLNNTIANNNAALMRQRVHQEQLLFYHLPPGPSPTLAFENNLIISTKAGAAARCTSLTAQPTNYSYNDTFNAGVLAPPTTCTSSGTATANLYQDPQFIDLTSGNVQTARTSPVVYAGDIQAPMLPAADLAGKNRTVCGKIDMGAYQTHPLPPILLTVTPNPAPGQSTVTLTATVTGNCNTPTGTIVFLDGTTILGSAPLNGSAVATFSTSFLFVGTHNLTATYAGDFNFENSTSNTVTEVITGPPTTTVLNSISPNPAQPLQPVTMIATVSSAYTVPTGTVTFVAGGTVLATATVGSNGVASGVATSLHAGTYLVTAGYGGSTEYAASTSNALTLTVLAGNTTTSLSAAPNLAAPGQTITLAAQVSGALSGIPLTGTVTFKEGATILGTANVGTNGLATLAPPRCSPEPISFSVSSPLSVAHGPGPDQPWGGSMDPTAAMCG